MANIRCEVCGGHEIKKTGEDSFTCMDCGIRYSKDDILKQLADAAAEPETTKTEPVDNVEYEAETAKNETIDDAADAPESDKHLETDCDISDGFSEEKADEPLTGVRTLNTDETDRKNIKRTAIAIIGFIAIATVIGIICACAGKDSSVSDSIGSDVLNYNDSVTFGWDDSDYETEDENSTSFSDIIPEQTEYTSIFKKVFPEINLMTKSDENNYYNKNSNSVFIIRDNQIMFVGERYSIIVAYNPDYSDASARIVIHPKNNSATRSQTYGVLCSLLEFLPIDFTPSFEVLNENLVHTKDSGPISYYEYSVEKDGKKINYMFEVNGEGEFSIYCDVF